MLPQSRQKQSRFLCLEPLEDRQLLSLTILDWFAYQQTADRPTLVREDYARQWLSPSWPNQSEMLLRYAVESATSLPITEDATALLGLPISPLPRLLDDPTAPSSSFTGSFRPSDQPKPLEGASGSLVPRRPPIGIDDGLDGNSTSRPSVVDKADLEKNHTPSPTQQPLLNREPLVGTRDLISGQAQRPDLAELRERLGRRVQEIRSFLPWGKPPWDSREVVIPPGGLAKDAAPAGTDARQRAKAAAAGQLLASHSVTFTQEEAALLGAKREAGHRASPSFFGTGGTDDMQGTGEDGTLQGMDVWSGMAVLDTAALDAVLQQLVTNLDQAGRTLANAFIDSASVPVLLGTLVTGLAMEITRRQRRKQALSLALAGLDADPTCSWMPGLPGSFNVNDE